MDQTAKERAIVADMESILARLCLLTRAAWREDLPAPFSRETMSKLIGLGAVEGLTLRRVPGVKKEVYLRAQTLLSRSSAVCDMVSDCMAQGYRIILPQDDEWPERLNVLGARMPQFLFARGNEALLRKQLIALAGSRRIDDTTAHISAHIGAQAAQEGYVLVSGGAQGADTAAQKGCLKSDGALILIPAYPCSELLRQQYLAQALDAGRLLIACETWPDERFSSSKALMRNHTIYALAGTGIVAAARKGIGGSWRGAVDALRGGYASVFAMDEQGEDFAGNRALLAIGAKPLNASGTLAAQLFERGAKE